MKSNLTRKQCKPCSEGAQPIQGEALREMHGQLRKDWKVIDEERLERAFKFPDFSHALQFANRVGEIAAEQDHHPDLSVTYGEVRIQIWTHKIHGLTESDFILAAKIDELD